LQGKTLKISALDQEHREMMAWRWLIISYNQLHLKDRVPLPRVLTVNYSRLRSMGKDSGASTSLDIQRVEQLIKSAAESAVGLTQVPDGYVALSEVTLDTFLSKTVELLQKLSASCSVFSSQQMKFEPINDKPGNVSRTDWLNLWMDMADQVSKSKTYSTSNPHLEELAQALQPHDIVEEEVPGSPSVGVPGPTDPPEWFERNGKTWYREDIDFLDVLPGQTFLTVVEKGAVYHAIDGEVPGPSAPKDKGKAQKNSSKPSPPKEGKGKEKEVSASQASTSPTPEAGKPGKAKSPITEENPLHVKGTPRSKALSDSQRDSLRKFFKLESSEVPGEVLAAMTKKQRSAFMKSRSLPRWATVAVLKDASNLEKILKGQLTKENANDSLRTSSKGPTAGRSQALEAWTRLKSDFQGTALLQKPVTAKERAFRKRFDSLKTQYGEQPHFPKLRQRPSQQGQGPSATRFSGRGDGLDGILTLAKAAGEIARAFRGA